MAFREDVSTLLFFFFLLWLNEDVSILNKIEVRDSHKNGAVLG